MEATFHHGKRPRKKDGTVIVEELEYVRVVLDDGNIVDRPATDEDKGRWSKAYAAFKGVEEPKPAPRFFGKKGK